MDLHWFLIRYIGPFYSAVHTLPRISLAETYYPEKCQKSWFRKYIELCWERFVQNNTNEFYQAYGFDVKNGNSKSDYVNEREFWTKIIPLNYPAKVNHAVILRDKYLFSIFMKAHDVQTPEVVAFANAGKFYLGTEKCGYDEWMHAILSLKVPMFLKEAGSCCAHGVTKINGEWPFDENYFNDGKFIVQKAIRNCSEVDRIQPNSVNTLRIVTVASRKTGGIELLSPGGLRVGGGGSVDNWAAGGQFVGIDRLGRLQKFGYFKPGKKTPNKSERQPQTDYVFEGAVVPYYNEAVELVKLAHSYMPEVVSIGWDVALAPEGPQLIEGNDDWEISLMQMAGGGLRDRCKELGIL